MKQIWLIILAAFLLAMSLSPHVLAAEICYPVAVEQSEDGAEIRKTYDLAPEEDPGGIPRSDFEQNGWHYTLTDLLKQETPEYQERQYSETVTVTSKNKDMESVLALLPQEKEFVTEDGLSGTLTLQLSTVRRRRDMGAPRRPLPPPAVTPTWRARTPSTSQSPSRTAAGP